MHHFTLSPILELLVIVKIIGILIAFFVAIISEVKLPGNAFAIFIRRWKLVLLLFGLGIAVLGEVIQNRKELKDAEEREAQYISIIEKADKTLVRLDSNLAVSTYVLRNSDKSLRNIGELQVAAQELNDSLRRQLSTQREVYNEVTGGSSIPRVHTLFAGNNKIIFSVENRGKYPIPDVIISFLDSYGIQRDFGNIDTDMLGADILKYGVTYQTGILNTGITNTFYMKDIPSTWDSLSYGVDVFWRNGSYKWGVKFKRNKKGDFVVVNSTYWDTKANKEIVFKK